MSEVVIARRFRGPPESGNGGYVSGLVASALPGDRPVQVTLRSPPPLDTPLSLERTDAGAALEHDGVVIAEAEPAELELDVPAPVSRAEAVEASKRYVGFDAHVFETCFVCGPKNEAGLRLFPGRVGDRELVAAPWEVAADLGEGDRVAPIYLWSALDCPSYFGSFVDAPMMLGRITASILSRPAVGASLVVLGWPLGRDGRKVYAGSAILGADSAVIAKAYTTWIVLRANTGHLTARASLAW